MQLHHQTLAHFNNVFMLAWWWPYKVETCSYV